MYMENEHSEKMGKFIFEMRKANGFTQKDLAEKLGVTDKAVSKWERGISCPDIALLVPLAKLLGVSASELLGGEKSTSPIQETAEAVVGEALKYSDKSTALKVKKIKQNILLGLSGVFLLAIVICLICEYAVSGKLWWSLIVIISLLASWILLLPFLRARDGIVRKTLIALSVLIIPYLAVLSTILGVALVFSMGTCIAVVSILGLWCTYGVFCKWSNRKLFALGIFFLITLAEQWGINHIVTVFIKEAATDWASDLLNGIITLILAVICFGADHFKAHSDKVN